MYALILTGFPGTLFTVRFDLRDINNPLLLNSSAGLSREASSLYGARGSYKQKALIFSSYLVLFLKSKRARRKKKKKKKPRKKKREKKIKKYPITAELKLPTPTREVLCALKTQVFLFRPDFDFLGRKTRQGARSCRLLPREL